MRKMKWIVCVLCLVMCVSLLPLGSGARGLMDPTRTADLSLTYDHEEQAFADLSIKIYRIADIEGYGTFTLTGFFADYAISLANIKSQSEWNKVAETAMAYVLADDIAPYATAQTDENGVADFADLPLGLYLVEGVKVETENGYYHFNTFPIVLPGLDAEDEWIYTVDANPKYVFEEKKPEPTNYRVLKLWKDTGFENVRPKEVKINIYKNGEFVESVVLSNGNDWAYAWQAPADGAVWTAVEANVKNGYTVTTEQRDNTFVITNTYPQKPPHQTGDASIGNVAVLALAVAGLGFVVFGVLRRRKI